MSLIRMEKVSKTFGAKPILEDIDIRVEHGERIGLIGRNGTGKSTIFRLILEQTEPTSGVIERMRKARFAYLAQIPNQNAESTIFDIVLHSFQELLDMERVLTKMEEKMADGDEAVMTPYAELQEQFSLRGGYDFRVRIKQVLQGLGFHPTEFDMPFKALSGGQRTRLMLALVLLQEADMLLLDEPENHLDLEAREWLETYLSTCPQSVVIISHDRRTLSAVATRIIELEHCRLTSYTGNYENYLEQKALRMEQQLAAFKRQEEYIRKEQAWINRFKAKATKARQAQSRMKRLEKVDRIDAPDAEAKTALFNLGEVVRSGAMVLEANRLSMAYGDMELYSDVSFIVNRGERVGIIGPNGAGKSTLLRQLAGEHNGTGGEVILGNKVSLGHYAQNHESLNIGADILTEVQEARPDWTPEQIRTFLGRFLFVGDDVFKKIGSLSGGELSRVSMSKLILSKRNLLLLDEPTNHLDIASREILEEALSEFPGTLIMVSHDRSLIDRLVDKLIIVENGTATVHLGNYEHYRWTKAQGGGQSPIAVEKEKPKDTEDVLKIRRGTYNIKSRQSNKEQQREERKRQRQLEQLEADIHAVEDVLENFGEKFAQCDPSDYAQTQLLHQEYEGLKADLKELYTSWEEMVAE